MGDGNRDYMTTMHNKTKMFNLKRIGNRRRIKIDLNGIET